jgi:hypothetical protein
MQVDERVAAVRLSKLWLMKREKGVASQTRQGKFLDARSRD